MYAINNLIKGFDNNYYSRGLRRRAFNKVAYEAGGGQTKRFWLLFVLIKHLDILYNSHEL